MPRPVLLSLVWLLGVALAIGTGLLAVRLVAERIGDEPQPSLSLEQIQQATRAGTTGTPSATPTASAPAVSPAPRATPTRATPSRAASPRPAVSRPAVSAPRTFALTGGRLSVRCAGTRAQLVYATPAQGWSLDERSVSGSTAEVRFETDDAEARLRVSCSSGAPVEVERRVETDRDDSGDDSNGGGSGRGGDDG